MRSLFGLFFVLALYLGTHAAEGEIISELNLFFTGEPKDDVEIYRQFIDQLRKALTQNSKSAVFNKPILPAISQGKNFILIHLSNFDGIRVTLAIDAADVYVVGSNHGDNSFFFKDGPIQAYNELFPNTNKRYFPYYGNYDSLEKSAKNRRENVDLGVEAFRSAIDQLVLVIYTDKSPPAKALMVIIQMISEAARYQYIEQMIVDRDIDFKPDPKVLSLENEWSSLSKQIQLAKNNKGNFPSPVQITNYDYSTIFVKDVNSEIVTNDIALLRYHTHKTTATVEDSNGEPCVIGVGEYESTVAAMAIPIGRRCNYGNRKWLGNEQFKGVEVEELNNISTP